MKISVKSLVMVATLAPMFGVAGRADASQITYVETFTASGSLGGNAFANNLVTLTMTADTADIVRMPTRWDLGLTSLMYNVDGVGSGSFLDLTSISLGNDGRFSIFLGNPRIYYGLFITSGIFPGLVAQNLGGMIGLTSGNIDLINASTTFNTSAGGLRIQSVSGEANLSSVPEPSALTLCAIGGALALVYKRARCRA